MGKSIEYGMNLEFKRKEWLLKESQRAAEMMNTNERKEVQRSSEYYKHIVLNLVLDDFDCFFQRHHNFQTKYLFVFDQNIFCPAGPITFL